jgi:TonB family protein
LGVIQKAQYGLEIVVTQNEAIAILPERPELPPFEPDVHRPCDSEVELPKPTKQVKPQYTDAAMRRGAAGTVNLQGVVETDGKVRRIRVYRSLDDDLDKSAVETLKKWEFEPGTFQGQPAPVVVSVEMTFTLKK